MSSLKRHGRRTGRFPLSWMPNDFIYYNSGPKIGGGAMGCRIEGPL